VARVDTAPPPANETWTGPNGLQVRRYSTGRADGSEALAILRDGALEQVVDLGRLPEVEVLPEVEAPGHPYRSEAREVERAVIVPEGRTGAVLAMLVAQGWRVVGRQGVGWVVER